MQGVAKGAERAGEDVVRVFVGASPSEVLPLKVLEHSIREHTKRAVDVSFMSDLRHPMPRDSRNQPGTRFSFYRFMIPELAGYRGRALYLDSDMVVFRDIQELWQIPFDGAHVLTVLTKDGLQTKNHSVLLIDCGAVGWKIGDIVQGLDDGQYGYDALMRELCIVPRERVRAGIPYVWNSYDEYEAGKTALIHYTALHSQPWTVTRHPWGRVWMEALFRAVDSGAVDLPMIQAEIDAGNVRPSLRYQLEARIADPRTLPDDIVRRDKGFVAPYQRLVHNRFTRRVRRKLQQLTRQVRPSRSAP
jgi:lipopolysaccharide biosynthesis glycosyltransferase